MLTGHAACTARVSGQVPHAERHLSFAATCGCPGPARQTDAASGATETAREPANRTGQTACLDGGCSYGGQPHRVEHCCRELRCPGLGLKQGRWLSLRAAAEARAVRPIALGRAWPGLSPFAQRNSVPAPRGRVLSREQTWPGRLSLACTQGEGVRWPCRPRCDGNCAILNQADTLKTRKRHG